MLVGVANATPGCTNNWLGGNCIGSITYTASTSLTGNVLNSDTITVDAGVTLSYNGYYSASGGAYTNLGVITGGAVPNTGGATVGPGGGGALPGNNAINFTSSYGGSGGAGGTCGGGTGQATPGGYGGNTLANGGIPVSNNCAGGNGGNGITQTSPVVNNANIIIWTGNLVKYLTSGGGGSGSTNGGEISGAGGNSIYGLYIQAASFSNSNSILCNGNAGGAATGGYGDYAGGGGGSGGSFCIITYNSAYTQGTSNILGAKGGAGSAAGGIGGIGGNGILANFIYTSQPIVTPTSTTLTNVIITSVPSTPVSLPFVNTIIFTANLIGGIAPYTYNFYVINSVTGVVVATQSSTSNTFSYTPTSFLVGNTLEANVIVYDSSSLTNNSIYTGLITITSFSPSGGGGGIGAYLPQFVVQGDNLIASVFLLLCGILFIARLLEWDEPGYKYVIMDAFAMMFLIMFFYFTVFSPTVTSSIIAKTTNSSSTGNVITNATITSYTPRVAVTSNGFIFLTSVTGLFLVLLAVLVVRDFVFTGNRSIKR